MNVQEYRKIQELLSLEEDLRVINMEIATLENAEKGFLDYSIISILRKEIIMSDDVIYIEEEKSFRIRQRINKEKEINQKKYELANIGVSIDEIRDLLQKELDKELPF